MTATSKMAKPKKAALKPTAAPKEASVKPNKQAAVIVKTYLPNPQSKNWCYPLTPPPHHSKMYVISTNLFSMPVWS
jgi:hypothetical protein